MSEVPPTNQGTSRFKKHFPWGWLMLAVLVPVPIIFIGSLPLVAIHRADTGFRTAKATINPEDLRAWALAAIRKYSQTNGYACEIPSFEIPSSIKSLYSYSPRAWVNPKTNERETCVMIIWGGGFFSWGFDIGQTNLVPYTNSEYPKAFILAPGIYYRREAAWGFLL